MGRTLLRSRYILPRLLLVAISLILVKPNDLSARHGRWYRYDYRHDRRQRHRIPGAMAQRHRLSLFLDALRVSGLADRLRDGGPFTVFAPTNRAIEKFGVRKWEDMVRSSNKRRLRRYLRGYCIKGGELEARDVKVDMAVFTMRRDGRLYIRKKGSTIHVDNAEVIFADIPASNGVIHIINEVLPPEDFKGPRPHYRYDEDDD